MQEPAMQPPRGRLRSRLADVLLFWAQCFRSSSEAQGTGNDAMAQQAGQAHALEEPVTHDWQHWARHQSEEMRTIPGRIECKIWTGGFLHRLHGVLAFSRPVYRFFVAVWLPTLGRKIWKRKWNPTRVYDGQSLDKPVPQRNNQNVNTGKKNARDVPTEQAKDPALL
jgi:hypothetical protein